MLSTRNRGLKAVLMLVQGSSGTKVGPCRSEDLADAKFGSIVPRTWLRFAPGVCTGKQVHSSYLEQHLVPDQARSASSGKDLLQRHIRAISMCDAQARLGIESTFCHDVKPSEP